MKYMTSAIAGLALIGLGACSTSTISDEHRWYQSLSTYNSVLSTLVELRQQGEIGDVAYEDIEASRECASDVLDNMRERAFDDEPGNVSSALMSSFDDCIGTMLYYYNRVKG